LWPLLVPLLVWPDGGQSNGRKRMLVPRRAFSWLPDSWCFQRNMDPLPITGCSEKETYIFFLFGAKMKIELNK
jgi:hypothetical protein